jgi:DNA-binding response OmpR family regulator
MSEKIKLLVVDNEIDICNFVKSFFGMRGYDVLTALNGDDALEKIKNNKVDVVLLDVVMRTETEGLIYLPKIKAASPSTSVLMVTGVEDEDSIKKAHEMGADGYITKPLVLEYLETTVMEKIKKAGSK